MPHTDKKLCLTTAILLVRGNKVLLCNHPRYNLWLPLGGHLEAGEDPVEGALREVKEESDYEPHEVELFGAHSARKWDHQMKFLVTPMYLDRHFAEDREHVAFVYFAKVLTDRDATQSSEHSDLRWFSKEELEGIGPMLKSEIQFYCNEALRTFAVS